MGNNSKKLEYMIFYCVDCGKVIQSHELESRKTPVKNYAFQCPHCSCEQFELYSPYNY